MSLGTILALISAAIATVFAGIGSIRGVGMSAEAGMGVLAEDPSKFGKLLVLEFSKVAKPLEKAYDWYSFNILPKMGSMVAGDPDSYRYLAESIRMHPGQEALKAMMQEAGFGHVDYHNMSAGIVALHVGIKC
mgnify:CR=1 FL=1